MNITLTDVLSRIASGRTDQSGQAGNAASASAAAKQLQASALLNSLVAGQTIGGRISSLQGGQILLDLGNGVELSARLDGNLKPTVGRQMLFEVKGNSSDNKLMLSPLYTNRSAGKSAAMSALDAAGMPLTRENLAMVDSMMEEGLAIDKDSLWQMGKLTAQFPKAQPETLVRLTGMGLEVNETNVAQYEAAKNMQHQLLYTMNDIADGLGEVLSSFQAEGEPLSGLKFMRDLLDALAGGREADGAAADGGKASAEVQMADGKPPLALLRDQLNGLIREIVDAEGKISEAGTQAADGQTVQPEQAADRQTAQPGQAAADGQAMQTGSVKADGQVAVLPELQEDVGKPDGQDQAARSVDGKVLPPDEPEGSVLPKDAIKLTAQGRTKLPEELLQRMESLQKEFAGRMKEFLAREWRMRPEQFSDKEDVKAFYQKIKHQAGQMQEAFAAAGKTETSAGQALQQMNQNLQFMENVNQLFPYLQIPLKASLESAHGELYVYQNKKGKASEDGSSSALLHLEMAHLGNMDVYVKMKDRDVSTQFTLEKEEILDFLAEHIHMLSERLEKKGYHMQSEMKYKKEEKKEDAISRIRGIEEGDKVVSYTAFDVRG